MASIYTPFGELVADRAPTQEPASAILQTGDEDLDVFKASMRRLAGAVCAITVRDSGQIVGIAATSVISLSMQPPSLLVSVRNGSSIMAALQSARQFTVHILSARQAIVADAFAGKFGHDSRASFAEWADHHLGLDRITGALSHIDCRVAQLVPVFTHTLVVGAVLRAEVGAHEEPPLVYYDGRYRDLS